MGSFCSWQTPDRTKLLFDPASPTLSSVRAIENGLGFLQPDRSRPLQASGKKLGSAGWEIIERALAAFQTL